MPNQMKRQEMRGADRPRVGPADPATIRQKLGEYDASVKRESRAGMYKGTPSAAPVRGRSSGLPNMGNSARRVMDDEIDKASKG